VGYFLDTNICIYALNGTYPEVARNMADRSPEEIKISVMVKAELLLGAEKSQRRSRTKKIVKAFLAPLEVVPFCGLAAEHYARIRSKLEGQGQPIGPNDLIIAATTVAHGGVLVTHNLKEFGRISALRTEDWVR